MKAQLYIGDMRERLAAIATDSVDAVVTDPPYGLGFMGKAWDSFRPADMPMRRSGQQDAVNAGASRQGGRQRASADYQKRQARDMRAYEDWMCECASMLLRVAKPGAHLVMFGGTRTFHRIWCAIEDAGWEIRDTLMWLYGSGFPKSANQSGEWQGWGTALKPGYEPIVLARKSLAGTVADNLNRYGVGALNIDGCRIGDFVNTTPSGVNRRNAKLCDLGYRPNSYKMDEKEPSGAPGRWPANVLHDGGEEVVAMFPDSESCNSPSQAKPEGKILGGARSQGAIYPGESGSAARFFWCPKASRADRNEGLQGEVNGHPTVKPTALMQWLCRLVTPAGGTVLDPFMGSGSTGKAAVLEGMHFIGIDLDGEYVDIAGRRISARDPLFTRVTTP